MSDFDLGALMQQAQQLKEQVDYVQKGLATVSVEGSAGAGMVKVTITGAQRVTKVEIDPAALEEDREMLQDLIVAAVNNGIEASKALAQERLGEMFPGGMPPGFPGL